MKLLTWAVIIQRIEHDNPKAAEMLRTQAKEVHKLRVAQQEENERLAKKTSFEGVLDEVRKKLQHAVEQAQKGHPGEADKECKDCHLEIEDAETTVKVQNSANVGVA